MFVVFFFSSRRRHTRCGRDWSSDVCSSDLVRVAVEQAALRRSIGDMILNLARRSQSLIDRQLELIDELERDAEDEALEQMFRLDHLATRMRRNAENLIVLSGGADAARRLTQPVPLVDQL